jgi:hypothetical protein
VQFQTASNAEHKASKKVDDIKKTVKVQTGKNGTAEELEVKFGLSAAQKALTEAEKNTAGCASKLERQEEELRVAEQKLACAKSEAKAANEALTLELQSHAFDFKAMSITDLAELSLALGEAPMVPAELRKDLQEAVSERFRKPDIKTLESIATAHRNGLSTRALAEAIKGMESQPWAVLYMLVQEENEPLDRADPFVDMLIKKVRDIDLPSMQFLNEQIDRLEHQARAFYVNELDATIHEGVIEAASRHWDDAAFKLCSAKFMAHAEAWPILHPGTRYFATLSTTDLTSLYVALDNDKRWLASPRGNALVGEVRLRFHERLMSTDISTPLMELASLARSAMSTSYVAQLSGPEIARLFELLQNNATAWLGEELKTFTAQVNSRFLGEYLPSIKAGTQQPEINLLGTGFMRLAQQWNYDVAKAAIAAGQAAAHENTPFGTLNADEVAELFVAVQTLTGRLPLSADVFNKALATKFAACYAQVNLKTHQMLTDAWPGMPPRTARFFAEIANRPGQQLLPLLRKVFGSLPGQFDPANSASSAVVLACFREAITYRTKLPGADTSPTAIMGWLAEVLPLVGASKAIAAWANYPGVFHDALHANNPLREYVDAAARVAQRQEPDLWASYAAMGPMAQFFADEEKPWTPALQKHFERLFKLRSGAPDQNICKYHLEVLETYQTIKDAKKGISHREAKGMVNRLEKLVRMAPEVPEGSSKQLQMLKRQVDNLVGESNVDRADSMISGWASAVNSAKAELTNQGVKSMVPPEVRARLADKMSAPPASAPSR